jgi:hypothetical protein
VTAGLHRREALALRLVVYSAYVVIAAGLAFTVGGDRPWLGWLVALLAVAAPGWRLMRWHMDEQELAAARDAHRQRPFGAGSEPPPMLGPGG